MKHNKKFTPYNRSKMSNKNNKYLVIHWVGAVSTAKNNADYFARKYVGASAHYFVDGSDDENQAIWQIVGENDAAWHVGAKTYKHTECRNTNSIGIEICCIKKNGQTIMDPIAIDRASKLAKSIIDMWGIKRENILRHFDVTRKNCPAEFVADTNRWNDFINKIYGSTPVEPESGEMNKLLKKYNVKTLEELDIKIEQHCGIDFSGGFLGSGREKIKELEAELTNRGKECIKLEAEINQIKSENSSFLKELVELRKENESLKKDLAKSIDTINELKANCDNSEWEANGREVTVVDGNVTTKTNYKLK